MPIDREGARQDDDERVGGTEILRVFTTLNSWTADAAQWSKLAAVPLVAKGMAAPDASSTGHPLPQLEAQLVGAPLSGIALAGSPVTAQPRVFYIGP